MHLRLQINQTKEKLALHKQEERFVKSAPKVGDLRGTGSQNRPPRKAKGSSGLAKTTSTATTAKAAPKLCACGEFEPEFNGYCRKCVERISREYKKVREWYQPIEDKYEELVEKTKAISGKKFLLKRKIERLEQKLSNPVDIVEEDTITTE